MRISKRVFSGKRASNCLGIEDNAFQGDSTISYLCLPLLKLDSHSATKSEQLSQDLFIAILPSSDLMHLFDYKLKVVAKAYLAAPKGALEFARVPVTVTLCWLGYAE